MPLISKSIPNLIGGVSQQPDAIRFDTQCDVQDNAYPSVLEGLIKRQNTEHIATAVSGTPGSSDNYFVHYINRDPVERYAVIINADTSSGSISVQPLDGSSPPTVLTPDDANDYLTVASGYSAASAFRAITIADYTFILNRTVVAQMTEDVATSRNPEALIWIKKGDYGTRYYVKIAGEGTTIDPNLEFQHTTPNGSGSADRDEIDTNFITNRIVTGLEADNTANNRYQIYLSNTASVIWVRRNKNDSSYANEPFDITGNDGLGGQGLIVIKDEVESLTDLPTYGPNGFTVRVRGKADDERDDYWVKFETYEGVNQGNGSWVETVAPGSSVSLDPKTMPHVLIRQADGRFRLAACTGDTYTVDGETYTLPKWGDRICGDESSNQNPTFVDSNINDIFLFKNRLGLLSGENVVLSESAEFFNFFRTTVIALLDADPIDVAASDSRVSILTAAIPFARQLVLFSEQSQFVLQSGNEPLTPLTVSMTRTTSYDSVSIVRPISLGNSIYFGFNRGDYSGIRQYYITSDTETIFDATDISAQVPQYIKGQLRDIAGSSHEDVFAVLMNEDRNVLYLYKYFDQNGERVQSAWCRFVFPSNTDILGIEFIDTTLYMTVSRGDGIHVEQIRMEPGLVDTGKSYRTLIDRRVDQDDCTLSGDGKTITLPYKYYTGSEIEVVTKSGVRIPVTTVTNDSADIVVQESLTSVDFWVGEKYTMTYQFSTPVLREAAQGGGQGTISEGRIQIRYLRLSYSQTGYFKVTVTPDYRDSSSHVMTARILGSGNNIVGQVALEEGVFKVPIYAKNNQCSIVVTNDTPIPCELTSAEFEMSFNPRSARYA